MNFKTLVCLLILFVLFVTIGQSHGCNNAPVALFYLHFGRGYASYKEIVDALRYQHSYFELSPTLL